MGGRNDPVYTKEVTIAAGAAVSDGADIRKLGARGLVLIANWTDMDAAQIGVQASYDDGSTYHDMWRVNSNADGFDPLVIPDPHSTAGDNDPILIPAEAWMIENATHIRLVSRDTTTYATPVNQTSAITFEIGTLA